MTSAKYRQPFLALCCSIKYKTHCVINTPAKVIERDWYFFAHCVLFTSCVPYKSLSGRRVYAACPPPVEPEITETPAQHEGSCHGSPPGAAPLTEQSFDNCIRLLLNHVTYVFQWNDDSVNNLVYGVGLIGITVNLDTHPVYVLLEIPLQDMEGEVCLCGTVTPLQKAAVCETLAVVLRKQPVLSFNLKRCWQPTSTTNHHLTLKGGENRGNYTTQWVGANRLDVARVEWRVL